MPLQPARAVRDQSRVAVRASRGHSPWTAYPVSEWRATHGACPGQFARHVPVAQESDRRPEDPLCDLIGPVVYVLDWRHRPSLDRVSILWSAPRSLSDTGAAGAVAAARRAVRESRRLHFARTAPVTRGGLILSKPPLVPSPPTATAPDSSANIPQHWPRQPGRASARTRLVVVWVLKKRRVQVPECRKRDVDT